MGTAPIRPSEIITAMQNGGEAFVETIASKDFHNAVLAIGPWRVTPTSAALGKRLKAYDKNSVEVEKDDGSWVKLSLKIDRDTRRGTNLYSVEEKPIDPEG